MYLEAKIYHKFRGKNPQQYANLTHQYIQRIIYFIQVRFISEM